VVDSGPPPGKRCRALTQQYMESIQEPPIGAFGGIVALIMTDKPSFSAGDVELLADSVRKTLEHLRDANERLGGNDGR
jgi:hypothetical protein